MPNRIIRSDMLTSERYWSVTTDARQLFQHLMLVADDFGLYTASNYALRATCYGLEKPSAEKVERWLNELNDAGLVIVYECNAARFIYIPRFRQLVRNKRSKYPIADNVFKHLTHELQCIRHADDMHVIRIGKEEEEEEVEEKKGKRGGKGAARLELPAWLDAAVWAQWHAYRNASKGWTVRARELSLATLTALHQQGHDPKKVVEQSIERGWTGLFPLKAGKGSGTDSLMAGAL
jgi:hypothetical protein